MMNGTVAAMLLPRSDPRSQQPVARRLRGDPQAAATEVGEEPRRRQSGGSEGAHRHAVHATARREPVSARARRREEQSAKKLPAPCAWLQAASPGAAYLCRLRAQVTFPGPWMTAAEVSRRF